MTVNALSHGCSLAESLEQITRMYEREMDRFDEMSRTVSESLLGQHHELQRWIGALNDSTPGLLHWSAGCSRSTLLAGSAWLALDQIVGENGVIVTTP